MSAVNSRSTRASMAQKIFLIGYLENHMDFACDRFESVDGGKDRQLKWDSLGKKLNFLNGAVKAGKGWRKYWMDQKSFVKERSREINQIMAKSGVNGIGKIKHLNEYELRVKALLTPLTINGDNGFELGEYEDNYINALINNNAQTQKEGEPNASTNTVAASALPVEKGSETSTTRERRYTQQNRINSRQKNMDKHFNIDTEYLKLEKQKLEIEKEKLNFEKEKFERLFLSNEQKFVQRIEIEREKAEALTEIARIVATCANELDLLD